MSSVDIYSLYVYSLNYYLLLGRTFFPLGYTLSELY